MTFSLISILRRSGLTRQSVLCRMAGIALLAVLSYGSMVGSVGAQRQDMEMLSPEEVAHFLRTAPLYSVLAAQHPAFRKLMEKVLGRASRNGGVSLADDIEISSHISRYMAHFIARSSDIAVAIYAADLRSVIASLNYRDPALCDDAINGRKLYALAYVPPVMVESLLRSAHQLVLRAVGTPHTPPSRQWVEQTLQRGIGKVRQSGGQVASPNEMSCAAYLTIIRQAKQLLTRPDYFLLLRGMLSLSARHAQTNA